MTLDPREEHRVRVQEGHYPMAIVVTPHEAKQLIAAIELANQVHPLAGVLVELTRVLKHHDGVYAHYLSYRAAAPGSG